jgi:carboxyl-terminal processing protease
MSTQEAVSKIRGPKGSSVELLILHKEAKAPTTVKIVRDAIPLISVKSRFLDEDAYLWVRLTRFNDRSTQELLDALHDQAQKAPIKGIVLDLRNNPGGLFKQAVTVADVFLKRGAIVSMRGRSGVILETHEARNSATDVTCPLVVLVNQGSASASEIVAGALQDHNRAVIIGERTFGKGSVQKIEPLGDGTAIKMTIARYYTPNGRSIQAEGIRPDLEVAFEPARENDAKLPRFSGPREKDLSRHLDNGTAKENKDADTPEKPKLMESDTKAMLEKDNQLRIALQMVRSLPKLSEIQSQ